MAQHLHLGKQGETLACRYLTSKGYRLLARNWRSHHWELDIVADHYGEIVFVEVKTRTTEDFAPALSSITPEKQEFLRKAAGCYLREHGLDAPVRMDVIVVVGSEPNFEIRHYRGTTGEL